MTISHSQAQYQDMRRHMVQSQLRTSDVNDPALLAAMARAPREAYVPADRASTAYMDRAIPLGDGRELNPPLTIGRLLVEAGIRKTDRVLLIGAGTGYAADILSDLAALVVAVEESASLASQARTALAGRGNVEIVEGPLAAGANAHAPYDVIIIDGAVERVPTEIVRQLAAGGRCVAAIQERGITRLARGVRVGDHLSFIPFADMEAAALPGFAKPKAFTF